MSGDADTGYGDAISTHYTVREYIQAGIAGAHIEDQTFPPKSGPRRRCISIEEMVGKLRAAMDAKQALDPDFVIMARCDLGGVLSWRPGKTGATIPQKAAPRGGCTVPLPNLGAIFFGWFRAPMFAIYRRLLSKPPLTAGSVTPS